MAYRFSQIDNDNLGWFESDPTRATLLRIRLLQGEIRGLRELHMQFQYPITAIAGANGSGKTTILALAACAFHGLRNGYRPRGRSLPYYTFSDFFVQTADEVPLEGISIGYQILYDDWRPTSSMPDGVGAAWQTRKKRRGGRWDNYDRRVPRPVVFLGIDRLVPHAEKNASKNYRMLFKHAQTSGWESELCTRVGRILGRSYRNFEYRQHSRYRLPVVQTGRAIYSGFNMGAGEDALFEMISTCLDCPSGTMLLVDELELGLHEDAQGRLVAELKRLCHKKKLQVICTTHSGRIIESLPPQGRIFLERVGTKTRIIEGISAKFATGKLAGQPSAELDVFVEDEVSKSLVVNALRADTRSRIRVVPVGSKAAVVRQLAARYKERRLTDTCAILDGDARHESTRLVNLFIDLLERRGKEEARSWVQRRIEFLPGTQSPEQWVLEQRGRNLYERFSREFGIGREKTEEILQAGSRARAHNELYEIAKLLVIEDLDLVLHQLVKAAYECCPKEATRVASFVSACLA